MLHAGVIALDVYSMTFHNAPATAACYNINTKIQRTFIWMHTHIYSSRAHKRGGTLNSAGAQGINFSAMTAVNLFCLLQAIKFDVHFNLKCKYAAPEAFRIHQPCHHSSLFSRSSSVTYICARCCAEHNPQRKYVFTHFLGRNKFELKPKGNRRRRDNNWCDLRQTYCKSLDSKSWMQPFD